MKTRYKIVPITVTALVGFVGGWAMKSELLSTDRTGPIQKIRYIMLLSMKNLLNTFN